MPGLVDRPGERRHRAPGRPPGRRGPRSRGSRGGRRSSSRPSRTPGSGSAWPSEVRCSRAIESSSFWFEAGRPLPPRAVAVEPPAVEADRDGHVVAADRLRRCPASSCGGVAIAGAAPPDHDEDQHDATTAIARERWGRREHARRIRQAAERDRGSRARIVPPQRCTEGRTPGQPVFAGFGDDDGSRLRAPVRAQTNPTTTSIGAPAVNTIDRARLSELMERERALFRERHPTEPSAVRGGPGLAPLRRADELDGPLARRPPGVRRRRRGRAVHRRRRQRVRRLLPRRHRRDGGARPQGRRRRDRAAGGAGHHD